MSSAIRLVDKIFSGLVKKADHRVTESPVAEAAVTEPVVTETGVTEAVVAEAVVVDRPVTEASATDMLPRPVGQVAVFIDLENLVHSLRQAPSPGSASTAAAASGVSGAPGGPATGPATSPATVIDRIALDAVCRGFAAAAVRRAYADWGNTLARPYLDTLGAAGVDLVQVSKLNYHGKNAADIRIAIDAIETLRTHPEITTYVLATGDGDFCPLAIRLREHQKTVIGVGVDHSVSARLAGVCASYHLWSSVAASVATNGLPTARQPGEHTPPSAVWPTVGSAVASTSTSVSTPKTWTVPADSAMTQPRAAQATPSPRTGLVAPSGRQTLIAALRGRRGGPVLTSVLKTDMLALDPGFRQVAYGGSTFTKFLQQHTDILDLRLDAGSGGQHVVTLRPFHTSGNAGGNPPTLPASTDR